MTKSDPLFDRMVHAFGDKLMMASFQNMVSAHSRNLLDYLTDDAREELLHRCIVRHKLTRRFNAESRRHHREKNNAV